MGTIAHAHAQGAIWRATEIANSPTANLRLLKGHGGEHVATISTARVREILRVKQNIERAAGRTAELLFMEGREPNAFASPESAIGPIVGINLGMMDLIADDFDGYAAILGHEYAHLVLGHRDVRQGREAVRQVGSALLGIFLARAGLQYSGTVADVVTTAMSTSFSRDEERDADRHGLNYAFSAGYDPKGAARVWGLMAARPGFYIPFVSTHPASSERLETLTRVAAEMSRPTQVAGVAPEARTKDQLESRPPADTTKLTGTLRKIYDTGTITLGYRTNAVPISYVTSQSSSASPIGYVVDICHEVVEALRTELKLPSLRIQYRQSEPANRLQLVRSGEVDLECGATANKLGRAADVAFSNTVLVVSSRFLVRSNTGIKSIRDLAGKTIVSTAGTNNLRWLHEANDGYQLQAKIVSVRGHSEAFSMVNSGNADAFFMDDILLQSVRAISGDPSATTILEEGYSRDAFALMFKKDDAPFKDFVDTVLADRFRNGTMARLYDKWFHLPVPPRSIRLAFNMTAETKAVFDNPNDRP